MSDESLKIYFAASIRGGRDDAALYRDIIEYLKTHGTVLTEHIGLPLSAMGESDKTERDIYQRDLAMLRDCDIVIAEVTQPSLGVGYELGCAEALGKPILCLFRPSSGRSLSAMLRGNAGFTCKDYATLDEAKVHVEAALKERDALAKHTIPVERFLSLASM